MSTDDSTSNGPSPAEELRQKVLTGAEVRRGGGEAKIEGGTWGSERELPAETLYELLVRPKNGEKPRAAVIVGLRVSGHLNFEASEAQAPLIAHNCYFDNPVNLTAAVVPELQLTECRVPGIAAGRLEVRGAVDIRRSNFWVLDLEEAHIGGSLDLDGAELGSRPCPPELGDSGLRPGEAPRKRHDDVALMGDRLRVDGHISCADGFSAAGVVRLPGARISGQLSFSGASLHQGLNADRLQVEQSMFCREGFTAGGEVRLLGAQISGQLSFAGAQLEHGLRADRLWVEQSMFCREGFRAAGEVCLRSARVSGQLSFADAHLEHGLRADRLWVEQSMLCREGFTAGGEVRMRSAWISGQLSFHGGALELLDLERCEVKDTLLLQFAQPPKKVTLTHAHIGVLHDSQATWPSTLEITGFTYNYLQTSEDERDDSAESAGVLQQLSSCLRLRSVPDVKRRLQWIRLAEEGGSGCSHWAWKRRHGKRPSSGTSFSPQPYSQLVSFYRREGRDSDARRVAYERERRGRKQLNLPGKAWSVFLQMTIGYGYRPLRLIGLLAAAIVIGAFLFSGLHADHLIEPNSRNEGPSFQALIYTIDRLIPVVGFGLDDSFTASGSAQWWAFAYTLFGWVLTVAVAASVTAAIRRA